MKKVIDRLWKSRLTRKKRGRSKEKGPMNRGHLHYRNSHDRVNIYTAEYLESQRFRCL
jgi:hypothetical protein